VPTSDGALAVWLDGREIAAGGATTLRSAHLGAAITRQSRIDGRVCDCCPTAMAETARGPLVAYRDRSDSEDRDISVVHLGEGSAPRPVHADGWTIDGCPVNGPAIASRGSDLAVAWYTEAGGRPAVRMAWSHDDGAHFGTPVDVTRGIGGTAVGRAQVVLADGEPGTGDALVAWTHRERERTSVRVRRVAADGSLGPVRVVGYPTGAHHGGGISMVRVGDDVLLLWTDGAADISQPRLTRLALREIATSPRVVVIDETPPDAGRPGVGQPIPALTGRGLSQQAMSLADHRGHPMLINLWASWCEPCLREMPELEALATTYGKRGLRLISINVDDVDGRAAALRIARDHDLAFEVWFDDTQTGQEMLAAPSLPVTLVVDAHGTIVYRRDGVISASDGDLRRVLDRVTSR